MDAAVSSETSVRNSSLHSVTSREHCRLYTYVVKEHVHTGKVRFNVYYC
jgi:hypothetical protein